MAKRRPSLTLSQMEMALGYTVDSVIDSEDSEGRFYSNLGMVARSSYEKTRRELEEHNKRQRHTEKYGTISERGLPESGAARSISSGQDMVVLKRESYIGFYSFTVDIHYGFGLSLPFLFSKDEAFETLKHNPTIVGVAPFFQRLPRELRERIYSFAIPEGELRITDPDELSGVNFAAGVGDLSGFYFSPRKDLALLRVSKQMRQEALPIAYRRTVFRLDDMDEFIKLAILIGRIGRDNIESLEFAWESRSDLDERCNNDNESLKALQCHDWLVSELPVLHISKCVQLLKQCKRLKYLCLYFESGVISSVSLDKFKADPGIRELCTVRGIERFESWGSWREPLEQYGCIRWLIEEMISSGKEGRKYE
ncbi:hypothetical protein AJ78_08185 [Emergomyces pasteurianus Ep9510]|uniref:2EXR domain-containing protein n=1 Tax=Emergomyces pasteurianus Ep9510 TaxID=1447872 RepID=A0A1J9Q3V6_9EURO|nr:hypothetical protein AJ78_08185 [Emergomyces pasteurianus Ep9510]